MALRMKIWTIIFKAYFVIQMLIAVVEFKRLTDEKDKYLFDIPRVEISQLFDNLYIEFLMIYLMIMVVNYAMYNTRKAICNSPHKIELFLFIFMNVFALVYFFVLSYKGFYIVLEYINSEDYLSSLLFTFYRQRSLKDRNIIQQKFECCGVVDGSIEYDFYNLPIPRSCCPENFKSCSNENAYNIGCSDVIRSTITPVIESCVFLIISATLLQFMPIVLALYAFILRAYPVPDKEDNNSHDGPKIQQIKEKNKSTNRKQMRKQKKK